MLPTLVGKLRFWCFPLSWAGKREIEVQHLFLLPLSFDPVPTVPQFTQQRSNQVTRVDLAFAHLVCAVLASQLTLPHSLFSLGYLTDSLTSRMEGHVGGYQGCVPGVLSQGSLAPKEPWLVTSVQDLSE